MTSGEVVVDSTEVGGCVTTVVPVVGDVCTVVVSSVTVGLVVLTDTVVGPWIDVVTSVPVVVFSGGCFGVVLELTVVVPVGFVPAVAVRGLVPPVDTEVVPVLVVPGLVLPVDTEVVPVKKVIVPRLSGLPDTVVGCVVVGSPGTVVVPDTVVDPRVDLLTSETVVVITGKVVVLGTVVVSGEVPVVPGI